MSLYELPKAMEPMIPSDDSGELNELALSLIKSTSRLSGALNSETRKAIAEFFRPMNSYYSNLIEGHNTHPIDIENALNQNYSKDTNKKDLQLESKAHIFLHREITNEIEENGVNPVDVEYIKSIHRRFYSHLPDSFKKVKSLEEETKTVIPGEFRTDEVRVGRHIGPSSKELEAFMNRFVQIYNPKDQTNNLQIRRVISIAASHHRLAWIHPFLDGNGRVVRLFSDACFVYEDLHSSGMWSISRGLARKSEQYINKLASADNRRYNDYDGRGNLSNRFLVDFCKFFLETAIDQANYIYEMIDVEKMLSNIKHFSSIMKHRIGLEVEMGYVLSDMFTKGKVTRSDALRVTGFSSKTLAKYIDMLNEMGLVNIEKEGKTVVYKPRYSVKYSTWLFPSLYPSTIEIDLERLM